MCPPVTRAELNNSDDIIREVGVVRVRKSDSKSFGTATSACTGKAAFASKANAEFAQRRKGLTAYRCRFCRNWHNGSNG